MDTSPPKKILITGIAGFIGFHLAQALKKRGDDVRGIDNFNAYYDPELKRERSKLLEKMGIEVFPFDICEEQKITECLESHAITHVVHLAAQAGVRHSMRAPYDYVSANLQGFVSILEACRRKKGVKVIFASSSSVYGSNKKIPFSVEDPTDHPVNLYGATKKANESMAYAYHHLYGLPVTALRYFTVYGPWGRPDMAYFHFADLISQGKPISLFNQGQMRRDFTYIDDIVQGTIAALDLGASFEIFNLGYHQSIELLSLVQLLEHHLQKKAILEFLPMQMGEVVETYADITKSQALLGYHPQISFEEGIARFASWYKCKAALHE